MKKETFQLVGYSALIALMIAGFAFSGAVEDAKYEEGIVRAKKDSALYVSPLNDTLVGRKIVLNDERTQSYKAYETIQIGDTIKFYNPSDNLVVNGKYSYSDMKVNNKNIEEAMEQFNKTKQLQQIQREARQK
ncbi:MAG: hypothetical protein J6Y49_02075 [Alphaproteobacteria bacterium]|nr:hypothetical protein [Alphaproteobacteria bacterium]